MWFCSEIVVGFGDNRDMSCHWPWCMCPKELLPQISRRTGEKCMCACSHLVGQDWIWTICSLSWVVLKTVLVCLIEAFFVAVVCECENRWPKCTLGLLSDMVYEFLLVCCFWVLQPMIDVNVHMWVNSWEPLIASGLSMFICFYCHWVCRSRLWSCFSYMLWLVGCSTKWSGALDIW